MSSRKAPFDGGTAHKTQGQSNLKAASIADVAKPTNKMMTEDGKCVDLRGCK